MVNLDSCPAGNLHLIFSFLLHRSMREFHRFRMMLAQVVTSSLTNFNGILHLHLRDPMEPFGGRTIQLELPIPIRSHYCHNMMIEQVLPVYLDMHKLDINSQTG